MQWERDGNARASRVVGLRDARLERASRVEVVSIERVDRDDAIERGSTRMTRETDDVGDDDARARSNATREGARGACAGTVARAVTHPMDTVKARAQVRGLGRGNSANGGWRGLYGGFGAVAAMAPAASGAYFVGYESGKRAFGESASASALAGMWAQALAGVVYTPMDVVKERLQTQGALAETARAGTYRNWTHAIRTIAREEGVRGLFRGYWAQNFVWWPWSAAYFMIYDGTRGTAAASTASGETSPTMSSACATLAASTATVMTHPLDLAKTRLQTLRFESASSASMRSVLSRVVEREGVRGLFAGVNARVAAVAPGSAISFYVYETLKQSGW